jgi:hypothetical protein
VGSIPPSQPVLQHPNTASETYPLLYVTYANWEDRVIGRPSLYATVALVAISAGYYLIVLRRRGEWVFQGPTGQLTDAPSEDQAIRSP